MMTKHCCRVGVFLALVTVPRTAAAQAPAAIDPPLPPSLVLPNYNRVLIGDREAIEAGAFVARADSGVATFYNPAGLALAQRAKVTAGLSTQEWNQYSVGTDAFTTTRLSNRSIGGVFGLVTGPGLGTGKWRFGMLIMRPVSVQPAMEMRVNSTTPQQTLATTYVTTSSLSDFAPTLAAAYAWTPRLRVGFSAGASAMGLYQNQALFVDGRSANALRTIDSTLYSDGTVWSAVFAGGVQWDISSHLRAGAKFTAPSVRVFGTTSMMYRGADTAGSQDSVKTFVDPDVEFHYRQPFALSAGLACSLGRTAIEFDVKQYAATGTYDLFRSVELVQRTTATGQGLTTDSQPFPAVSYSGQRVTNFALGGSFRFNEAVTVHGGVYNDRSPVADTGASPVFTRMNLTGFTAGASVNILRVVGSAGIAYAWGQESMNFDSAMGPVHSTIGLRSLQLFYAFSVSF